MILQELIVRLNRPINLYIKESDDLYVLFYSKAYSFKLRDKDIKYSLQGDKMFKKYFSIKKVNIETSN